MTMFRDRMKLAASLAPALALAACATAEEAVVEKLAETYNADLTGAQVVGGGDPDGSAKAELSVSDNLDQICYDVGSIQGIGPITSIMIHRGAPGVDGPGVLTMKQANEGGWKGCTGRSEWLEDSIDKNFTSYYVLIHTSDYPKGALRGQLRQ